MSAHVDPRVLDAASGAARAEALSHAAGCRECRRAIAAHDPSLLFALLAGTPVPAPVLAAVSRGTARRIAARPAPVRAAAAAVAAVALASTAALFGSRFETSPEIATVPRADVEVGSTSPVSQVVDFTVGNTQVVMVYNPELEL